MVTFHLIFKNLTTKLLKHLAILAHFEGTTPSLIGIYFMGLIPRCFHPTNYIPMGQKTWSRMVCDVDKFEELGIKLK